jgi:hypothetical protein
MLIGKGRLEEEEWKGGRREMEGRRKFHPPSFHPRTFQSFSLQSCESVS